MKKIIVTLLLAALVLAAVPALAQNAFTAADGGIVPTIQYTTYEASALWKWTFCRTSTMKTRPSP